MLGRRAVSRQHACLFSPSAEQRLRSNETLKSQGMNNRAIAHRLGVREMAIRKLVRRSKPQRQLALPAIPTAAEKPAATAAPTATSTDIVSARTAAAGYAGARPPRRPTQSIAPRLRGRARCGTLD